MFPPQQQQQQQQNQQNKTKKQVKLVSKFLFGNKILFLPIEKLIACVLIQIQFQLTQKEREALICIWRGNRRRLICISRKGKCHVINRDFSRFDGFLEVGRRESYLPGLTLFLLIYWGVISRPFGSHLICIPPPHLHTDHRNCNKFHPWHSAETEFKWSNQQNSFESIHSLI